MAGWHNRGGNIHRCHSSRQYEAPLYATPGFPGVPICLPALPGAHAPGYYMPPPRGSKFRAPLGAPDTVNFVNRGEAKPKPEPRALPCGGRHRIARGAARQGGTPGTGQKTIQNPAAWRGGIIVAAIFTIAIQPGQYEAPLYATPGFPGVPIWVACPTWGSRPRLFYAAPKGLQIPRSSRSARYC